MGLEHRTFGYEIKALSDDGTFEGYAEIFGNVDSVGDIARKGCFAKTLAEHKGIVPVLNIHGHQVGLGLEAHEDDIGLYVKGEINLLVQEGREAHALAKQQFSHGAKMGLSIGYYAIDFSYDTNGVRTLKSVDLIEYSLTPFPANKLAGITSIKSLLEGKNELEIAHKKREIEDFLRGAGCSSKQAKSAVSAIFGDEDEAKDAADQAELKMMLKRLIETT